MWRIGVDLGGTKIEIAVLDPQGVVRLRKRVETPPGYDDTVAAIASLVREAAAQFPRAVTVGVGTPGARSLRTGRMRNSNSTCLRDRPLKEDLEAALGREIRIANDANCFTLSEAVDGAAAEARVVFGVILGTGVGGGIVVDGRILEGAHAIAGEWGHIALPAPRDDERPGPRCYCGRRGCIETWLSGPGLAADHCAHGGAALDAGTLAARAASGDAACEASLARHEERLARSLALVVNLLDPDVIVLGGGLSNLGRLYKNVPRLWGPHVFSDEVHTRLEPPKHGDSSGVRGAAWLWGR